MLMLILILPFLEGRLQSYFNTSHVNVNLINLFDISPNNSISIHLMLMLILNVPLFQPPVLLISIHLMLMLIKNRIMTCYLNCIISIHLMLMLIDFDSFWGGGCSNFNTSHVNVNRIEL